MDKAGAHTRSIFGDQNRLSAIQISSYLQGVKQVAFATVSSKGEPMVTPVDSVLYHGRFYISTDETSLRARHLRRSPLLSLTYFEGADPVIVVHGSADFVGPKNRAFGALDLEWIKAYGQSILKLSNTVIFIRANPKRMLAYSLHPQRFKSAKHH